MAKVKPIGHIWGLIFNKYVCYSFRVNRTILGRDIANVSKSLFKSYLVNKNLWPAVEEPAAAACEPVQKQKQYTGVTWLSQWRQFEPSNGKRSGTVIYLKQH